jgi:predicted component of type VI protein secretion system
LLVNLTPRTFQAVNNCKSIFKNKNIVGVRTLWAEGGMRKWEKLLKKQQTSRKNKK